MKLTQHQFVRQKPMTSRTNWFSQQVYSLFLRSYIRQCHYAFRNQLTNVVHMNLNMFRVIVKDRISGNPDSTSVVTIQPHRSRTLHSKIQQQPSKPDKFRSDF
ncbi:unnamed protein product [Linum trigynum]|uniref:Uncharacterized protein n=1 Tax=Linum trigynum TaxID=586398 RepID=A0AAV2GK63_9ROSI